MKPFATALFCLAILPASGWAQDSGPGPIAPATEHVYSVTLLKRLIATEATFAFSAEATNGDTDGEAGEATTSTSTNGTFQATLEQGNVAGTWNAVDVGGYAIWVAHADGETQTFSAIGLSTPDVVIGRATISSTNASRFGAFFRFLGIGGQSSFFFGEATVDEPPPEEPEMPMEMAS